MSRVLSASDICAEALGAIGSFPVTETAPDPQVLRRALTWLDMILDQRAGVMRLFRRLAPGTLSMAITNGTQDYDLYAVLGTALPADGIQFVTAAWLEDDNGNRTPVEIVTAQRFEEVRRLDAEGSPCVIHIDRQADGADIGPTLRIFPTPSATDPTVWALKLICQRFAPNVAPGGVTGDMPVSEVAHEMGVAWQRWLVCTLAHDLGSGPIMKLPESSLNRFGQMATGAKAELEAFENREQQTTPPICEPWGLS
jgi:hypothetical protein